MTPACRICGHNLERRDRNHLPAWWCPGECQSFAEPLSVADHLKAARDALTASEGPTKEGEQT